MVVQAGGDQGHYFSMTAHIRRMGNPGLRKPEAIRANVMDDSPYLPQGNMD